ncbi:MAG: glycerate kinase [Alphaproteobacteria bacterium]
MDFEELGRNKVASKFLLDLFNFGVSKVQPKNILKDFLEVSNDKVTIKGTSKKTTYTKINKIIIICVGKASVDMAETAKKIFSKSSLQLEQKVLVVNKENYKKVSGFKCFVSGHPIPNSNGLIASKFIENKIGKLTKDDLVLIFVSGGGSAMLPYPVKSISLKDKIETNKILLESGANIRQINSVRKHLSKIKGGNFIKMCSPAKVHGLILSDVVGDDLGSIASGMTVCDNSSFFDVLKILKNYKILESIPQKVKKYLFQGCENSKLETPKKNDPIFKQVKNTLIGSNYQCIQNIKNLKKNIDSKIFFKDVDEDVESFSRKFVNKLQKFDYNKPILLISGGETTVKIKGNGKGGRNQEFALHFLLEMNKKLPNKKFFLLSAGTDGRDGPTNAAGAIVNNGSLELIEKKKINIIKELHNNNSYKVLKKINSLIIIKGTNTNVADIQLLLLF